ncbi:MAG: NifU family protein [Phycisphaeraceae bacterium]|nr:NifU family protein [Phycisphaeraceae bacterium]
MNNGQTSQSTVADRVEHVLNLIRPAVQADGGDVEFVAFTEDGTVQIRLHGACVGCPSSSVTLQVGIERNLKNHIPEVRRVEAVA